MRKLRFLVFILPVLLIFQSSAYAQQYTKGTKKQKGTIESIYKPSMSVKDSYKKTTTTKTDDVKTDTEKTKQDNSIFDKIKSKVEEIIDNIKSIGSKDEPKDEAGTDEEKQPGDTITNKPPDDSKVPGDTITNRPPDDGKVPGDTITNRPPDDGKVPGDTITNKPQDEGTPIIIGDPGFEVEVPEGFNPDPGFYVPLPENYDPNNPERIIFTPGDEKQKPEGKIPGDEGGFTIIGDPGFEVEVPEGFNPDPGFYVPLPENYDPNNPERITFTPGDKDKPTGETPATNGNGEGGFTIIGDPGFEVEVPEGFNPDPGFTVQPPEGYDPERPEFIPIIPSDTQPEGKVPGDEGGLTIIGDPGFNPDIQGTLPDIDPGFTPDIQGPLPDIDPGFNPIKPDGNEERTPVIIGDPGFYVDVPGSIRDADPGFYIDIPGDVRDADPGFYFNPNEGKDGNKQKDEGDSKFEKQPPKGSDAGKQPKSKDGDSKDSKISNDSKDSKNKGKDKDGKVKNDSGKGAKDSGNDKQPITIIGDPGFTKTIPEGTPDTDPGFTRVIPEGTPDTDPGFTKTPGGNDSKINDKNPKEKKPSGKISNSKQKDDNNKIKDADKEDGIISNDKVISGKTTDGKETKIESDIKVIDSDSKTKDISPISNSNSKESIKSGSGMDLDKIEEIEGKEDKGQLNDRKLIENERKKPVQDLKIQF